MIWQGVIRYAGDIVDVLVYGNQEVGRYEGKT